MSETKNPTKPPKGEPWKPKEKFDKKGNKEKQKQDT
jgi:translation initiation factor eIF-2B subunit delta